MTGPRAIEIANRHPRLGLNRHAVARVIHLLEAHHAAIAAGLRGRRVLAPLPPGELSLVFLTDAALARLHGEFLADASTTDVITFEGEPALGTAGEICVSADTAAVYARRHRRDFSEELTLYLVHGWLHLTGHDDLEPAKKRAMRRAEARAMKLLRAQKSIPRFVLRPTKSAAPRKAARGMLR